MKVRTSYKELIDENIMKYQRDNVEFCQLDILKDLYPRSTSCCAGIVSYIITSFIRRALINVKQSGSTYFLTTTYPDLDINQELDAIGFFRPINF